MTTMLSWRTRAGRHMYGNEQNAREWTSNALCSHDALDSNVCKCFFDSFGKLLKFKRLFAKKKRAADDQRINARGRKQTPIY